jgi:ribonuclease HII
VSQTQFSASTPSACLTYENQALQAGYRLIAGLDEAGRGPLAGPVVAAAVILPADPSPLFAVKDSKQLTEQKKKKTVYIDP